MITCESHAQSMHTILELLRNYFILFSLYSSLISSFFTWWFNTYVLSTYYVTVPMLGPRDRVEYDTVLGFKELKGVYLTIIIIRQWFLVSFKPLGNHQPTNSLAL